MTNLETDSFYTVLVAGMLLFRVSVESGESLGEAMVDGRPGVLRCIDLFGAPLAIRLLSIDALILESPETRARALDFGNKYADLYGDDAEPWT